MKNNLNEKIINNVKQKISISNFIEEEEYNMKQNSKNILKSVGIAVCMIFCITGVVFAKDIGELINNIFGGNASDGVQVAVDNGYYEKVDLNYIESDGIKVAVDSFLIDDYNFDMNFKIELDKKYNPEKMGSMNIRDLKIVNENNEIVFITAEYNKSDEEIFWGGYGIEPQMTGENEITLHLAASGTDEHKIIKAQKLYVTFSKLEFGKDCYSEKKEITGDWKYELDVPEEMYNSEIVLYKAIKCNDKNTTVGEYGMLSNTAFKITIPESTTDKVDYELLHDRSPKSIFDMIAFQKEYIETEDGKKFESSQRSDGDGGYGLPAEEHKIIDYHQTFNLTKFDATDKLTVHIFTNKGEEIMIEYERIK